LANSGKADEENQAGGVSAFTLASGGDMSLADEDTVEALEKKFSYVYPYKYLENLYTKTTVSELKMAAMAERDEGAYDLMEHGEDEIPVPVFAGGSKNRIYDEDAGGEEHRSDAGDKPAGADKKFSVSGTERGNAYHRIMQLLSWDRILMPVMDKIPSGFDEYLGVITSE
ncbi:MAG: hypothetical protein ILP17_10375, partial [Lachnospiraceae bacterium]|nr:hypothetical protein [Lachnospiraceae bacterium]